jgi:tetratricopeptide (TPR) repeat protein
VSCTQTRIDDTDVLQSIFSRYGRIAVRISLLLQYENDFKEAVETRPQVVGAYADLLELVCHVTFACVQGSRNRESDRGTGSQIDEKFATYFKLFSTRWKRLVYFATWNIRKHSQIKSGVEPGSIRQFLEVQDRPLQMILETRVHSPIEGSFEWFSSYLYDFTVADSNVLLVTGGPGCGKSALAQWTTERPQVSAEQDTWTIIPYAISKLSTILNVVHELTLAGADVPVEALPVRILKGILLQMLDRLVLRWKTQEAILRVVSETAKASARGASDSEVEESLCKGIRMALTSDIHFMLIIDGLDQIRGGEPAAIRLLERLENVLSEKNNSSKLIVFSSPFQAKIRTGNMQQVTMQASSDLHVAVRNMISSIPQFDRFESDQLESIVAAVVTRAQGSFAWAEMVLEYARKQSTLSEVMDSVQSAPQSMSDLLDYHLSHLPLDQFETRSILAWLVASKRPLLVKEIEQLFNIDPKGPSCTSRLVSREGEAFNSVRPLVMVRDGVVSFRHRLIRDHIIDRARSVHGESNAGEFPFSLKEAHYDLLTRCLEWVKRYVPDQVPVSLNKLSLEEQNRFFDKHVLLEYTARYWLLHLSSSPLLAPDGKFQFNAIVPRSLPESVLLAQLELTCRESQFTRSCIAELYRLSAEVRGSVLGERSKAFLQSMVFSARASEKVHASDADDHCYEAWRLSKDILGPSAITLTCAELFLGCHNKTSSDRKEEVLKDLVLTDWDDSIISHSHKLGYLQTLVQMYGARNDTGSARAVSKQFHQGVVQRYGQNSTQAAETAGFLADRFELSSNDEMAIEVARTKYEHMTRTMDVTDERRILYTLHLAQLYEEKHDLKQAETVLADLWAGLTSREVDSASTLEKKASVAVVYCHFLRRRSRKDEAEKVIQEMLSDIQNMGIHSQEILEPAQALRGEAKEMGLSDLELSLSILIWGYYRRSGQQYSREAVSVAQSLVTSMDKMVSVENASGLSTQNRELLRELLDSITSLQSHLHLSLPTLMLCRKLMAVYIQDENWQEASATAWAVFKHVWPSVEDPKCIKTFPSDIAPHVADIALSLAHCHFRRFNLEKATVVYENGFRALITTEKVAVPTVLAMMKTVVEFFETTFQFPKALGLLRQVTYFLESRLGQSHRYTIDNLYYEANLASRLGKQNEAKRCYQKIYSANLRDKKISAAGMEAAVALIGMHEQERQWDSALAIYRHLWPALIVDGGDDRSLFDKHLEKTYMGYTSALGTQNTARDNFAERYKVTSDYQRSCSQVYGPTHERTLKATVLLAELCQDREDHIDEAILLYKGLLQVDDLVPKSQSSKSLDQMSQPLPVSLKHRLAWLYARKKTNSPEAGSLFMEEFQLGKRQHGYSAATTLSWLREVALFHSRQKSMESVYRGTQILRAYVLEGLQVNNSQIGDRLTEWAQKVADIYLECGYMEAGNRLLDEIRYRVVYGSETASQRQQDSVFVAAFEGALTLGKVSSCHAQSEMRHEVQLYETFSKDFSGHDLIQALRDGQLLFRFQAEHGRMRAMNECRQKLFDYFCASLSASSLENKDVVREFYDICLREVLLDDYNIRILTATSESVRNLCNSSRFQEASDLAGVLHSFLHLTEGLCSYESILTSIKICQYLNGYNTAKFEDGKVQHEMAVESKLLLQEIMAAAKDIKIQFVELPFAELNDLIMLLGEYELFDELEVRTSSYDQSRSIGLITYH